MANSGTSSAPESKAERQIAFAEYYNVWGTMDLSYMFVTVPHGTFLELPSEFNRLPQLLPGGYYNCLDREGKLHEWGLIQARGARGKELLVYMGWLDFLVKTGYRPGDKLMELLQKKMAFENADGDVLVFITAPRGHVWRTPLFLAQLPELRSGDRVECIDVFERTHTWGLLEENHRQRPNLTVFSGWSKFMRMNDYIPGTEIWFIFNRPERKFYVSWDDVNDFNDIL